MAGRRKEYSGECWRADIEGEAFEIGYSDEERVKSTWSNAWQIEEIRVDRITAVAVLLVESETLPKPFMRADAHVRL